MHTLIALSLVTLSCDLDEGPGEEAEEVGKAIKDGKPIDQIGDEVKDVGDAITSDRSKLEKRLDAVDDWIQKQGDKLQASGEEAGEDIEAEMSKLSDRVDELQAKLAEGTEEVGEDIAAQVDKLEADIEEMGKKSEG